ncbi:hypothetical protein ACLOJK_028711 [Asimina triloba]
MQAVVRRRLSQALFSAAPSSTRLLTFKSAAPLPESPLNPLPPPTLAALWSAIQHRGAKVLGSDVLPPFPYLPYKALSFVRLGNVVQRKGRIYQVLKAQHTQHGRGGATIQVFIYELYFSGFITSISFDYLLSLRKVELRDVDTGNKVTERFRTDESIERVFVQEKSYTYLYTEGDTIVIMEPDTFEQMEVDKDLFGKAAAYLKDNMKVTLQTYDGKPMSASVPSRVTCAVAEAQPPTKGITATPQAFPGVHVVMFLTHGSLLFIMLFTLGCVLV